MATTSMSTGRPSAWRARARTGSDARRAADWLGTAGWIAKGVVYLLIGLIALQMAIGHGEQQASKQGALRTLAEQPAGERSGRSGP